MGVKCGSCGTYISKRGWLSKFFLGKRTFHCHICGLVACKKECRRYCYDPTKIVASATLVLVEACRGCSGRVEADSNIDLVVLAYQEGKSDGERIYDHSRSAENGAGFIRWSGEYANRSMSEDNDDYAEYSDYDYDYTDDSSYADEVRSEYRIGESYSADELRYGGHDELGEAISEPESDDEYYARSDVRQYWDDFRYQRGEGSRPPERRWRLRQPAEPAAREERSGSVHVGEATATAMTADTIVRQAVMESGEQDTESNVERPGATRVESFIPAGWEFKRAYVAGFTAGQAARTRQRASEEERRREEEEEYWDDRERAEEDRRRQEEEDQLDYEDYTS